MMKNFKSVLVSMLAGTMLCACSTDQFIPEDEHLKGADGDGFFMALDIQMPDGKGGTRSTTNDDGTSDGGTEIGLDYENTVSNALVVLAAKEAGGGYLKYGFIAAGEVRGNRIDNFSSGNTKQYRAKARLQKTNLNSYYTRPGATTGNPEVYVFVFCNPTTDLLDKFADSNMELGSNKWINDVCNVKQTNASTANENIGIWGSNSFLMNNVKLSLRELPASLVEWESFNSYDKAFHLSDVNEIIVDNTTKIINNSDQAVNKDNTQRGPIEVERSVARFDFRDGSGTGVNMYDVLFQTDEDGSNPKTLVKVQLQKMCLVNMSNQFYYIPRVSDDGDGLLAPDNTNPVGFTFGNTPGGFKFCGVEKPWTRNTTTGEYSEGNYVVGPYFQTFGGDALRTGFSKYFNFAFFEDDGSFNNEVMSSTRWDVVKIDDILKNNVVDDNYTGKKPDGNGNFAPGDYKVWRYVTENVIPQDPTKQVNGISTGVVFKARIFGADDLTGVTDEDWNPGANLNIANCLNGKPFTYDGVEHSALTGNSKDDPILYYYAGKLYLGWRHIRQAAIQAAVSITAAGAIEINRSNSLYKAVFGDGPIPPTYNVYSTAENKVVERNTVYIKDGDTEHPIKLVDPQWETNKAEWEKSADYAWVVWAKGKEVGDDATGSNSSPALQAMRQAITDAGITIYQSSKDGTTAGYYCYYYYWNRHNDNGIPGVMGPMEFDVVRNNVYKLSVNSISRLGHPRIPENDPDNPKPWTPDESDYIYLDVNVQIVPWAVRVNGIIF